MTSRTWPQGSSTKSSPGFIVADVPSAVGRLPTITHPERSATSAVVSPTPPGTERAGIVANSRWWPPGDTSTIVVPVPCALAALLKLLTSTLPAVSRPWLRGTIATPYGLTSPLAGMVLATVATVCRPPTKEPPAPVLAAAGRTPATAAAAATESSPTARFLTNPLFIRVSPSARDGACDRTRPRQARPGTRRSLSLREAAATGLEPVRNCAGNFRHQENGMTERNGPTPE